MDDRRLSERITIGFETRLTKGDRDYVGHIDNLSESGMCVVTLPSTYPFDAGPGTMFSVSFWPFAGEALSMTCRLRWSRKTPGHGLTTRIGLEIIDPPWQESNYFI